MSVNVYLDTLDNSNPQIGSLRFIYQLFGYHKGSNEGTAYFEYWSISEQMYNDTDPPSLAFFDSDGQRINEACLDSWPPCS